MRNNVIRNNAIRLHAIRRLVTPYGARTLTVSLLLSGAMLSTAAVGADPLSLQGILDSHQDRALLATLCQRDDPKAQAACLKDAKIPKQSQYYSSDTSHLGSAQLKGDANLMSQGQAALKAQGFEAEAKARHDKMDARRADGSIPSLSSLETQYGDYVKHADVVAGGRHDKYHDCTGGVRYRYSKVDKTCITPTHAPIQCTLTRVRIKDTLQTGTVTVHPHPTRTDDHGGKYYAFTLPISPALITQVRVHFGQPLKVWSRDNVLTLSLNHQSLGTMTPDGYYDYNLAIGTHDHTFSTNQSLSSHQGTFEIHMARRWVWAWRLTDDLALTMTYRHAVPVMGWRHDCNETALRGASCAPTSAPRCTQGQGTRALAGVLVTEHCWQQTQSWACQVADTCTQLPHLGGDEAHMKAGDTTCTPTGRVCQTTVAGVCIANRQTERCTTKVEESTKLVCSAPPDVADCAKYPTASWCQTPHYRSPSGVAEALSQLAIQKAMTCGANPDDPKNPPECKLGGFDPKTLRFFGGESKRCAKGAVKSFDCCGLHEGWAGKIGAHQCDSEAREIAMGKQKQTVIKLGTYCAEKVLGACIRKKETYCVYPSKLARIATQGAIGQLHQSLGNAEHPHCEGLTKEAFAKLDFSQMDFSSLVGDIQPPTLPDMTALKTHYQDFDTTQQINHGDQPVTGSDLAKRYKDLDPHTLNELGVGTQPDRQGHVLPDEDAIKARYRQMSPP